MTEQHIHLAVWRLAQAHGHEWATEQVLSCFGKDGRAPLAEVERVDQECRDTAPDNGLPAGLYPATSHVTGTGRVVWMQSQRRAEIELEIHRPSTLVGGLAGGTIPVLWAAVSVRQDGTAYEVTPIKSSALAEDRHYREMLYLLDILDCGGADNSEYDPQDDAWTTCVRRLSPHYAYADITRAYWSGIRDGKIDVPSEPGLGWDGQIWKTGTYTYLSKEEAIERYAPLIVD